MDRSIRRWQSSLELPGQALDSDQEKDRARSMSDTANRMLPLRISSSRLESGLVDDLQIDIPMDQEEDEGKDELKSDLSVDGKIDMRLISSGRVHHATGDLQMQRRRIPEFQSPEHAGISEPEISKYSDENEAFSMGRNSHSKSQHPQEVELVDLQVSKSHASSLSEDRDNTKEFNPAGIPLLNQGVDHPQWVPKKLERAPSFHNLFRTKPFVGKEAMSLWESYKSEPNAKVLRPGIPDLLRFVATPPSFVEDDLKSDIEINPQLAKRKKKNGELLAFRPGNRTLGMWEGVFVRNTLHSFGGVMFLKLGLVFGNRGLLNGSLAILLSAFVVIITACSFAAIVSNSEIESGGVYRMLSRSLGPKVGGVIGIIFVISNSISCGLFCLAFSVTIVESIGFSMTGNADWDVRLYALFAVMFVLVFYLAGMMWAVRLDVVFFFIVMGSFLSIIIGCFTINTNEALGITGFNFKTVENNLGIPETSQYTFTQTIGIFFPALTGISSSTLMMNRLKDPRKTLANGTVLAALFSPSVYILVGWFLGGTLTSQALSRTDLGPLVQVSILDPLVYAGIFVAAISSALIALNSAPRVLRAIAADNIFPRFQIFLRSSTRDNIPFTALLPAIIIALLTIFSGTINFIASYLTITSLLLYALINLSCFATSLFGSSSWRPTFRFYNKWVALLGVSLCFIMMIRINLIASVIAFIACGILLKIVSNLNVSANWGSLDEAYRVNAAIEGLALLRQVKPHAKNFRPSIVLMMGNMMKRYTLIKLLTYMVDSRGLLICGSIHVLPEKDIDLRHRLESYYTWSTERERSDAALNSLGAHAFFQDTISESFVEGFSSLCQLSGLGHLRSNIVAMGFSDKWRFDTVRCEQFVNQLRMALSLRNGIIVCRHWKQFEFKAAYQGTLDVWWLSDDGGLSLLLPHLLRCHSHWKDVSIRILTVSVSGRDAGLLYGLLKNLRIKAEIKPVDLNVDRQGWLIPESSTIDRFRELLDDPQADSWVKQRETLQFLHVSELISSYSSGCKMLFISMPAPRLGLDPRLFMGWLDSLASQPLPTMFVRGNQQTVLVYD